MLVGDVADDLFQNVFQRHHAFDFAVFVDHQREVGLAAAKRLELLGQCADVGHEPRRQRDCHDVNLAEVAFGVLQDAKQILGMQDPDDVLGLVAP